MNLRCRIMSTQQLVYHNFLRLSELLFWLEVHVNFPSLKNIFFNYSDSTWMHIKDCVMHLKAPEEASNNKYMTLMKCVFYYPSVYFRPPCNSCTNILLLFRLERALMWILPVWCADTTSNAHVRHETCDTHESSRRSMWVKFSQGWTVTLNHVLFFAVWGYFGTHLYFPLIFLFNLNIFLTHANQKRTWSPWPALIIVSMQEETTIWCTKL